MNWRELAKRFSRVKVAARRVHDYRHDRTIKVIIIESGGWVGNFGNFIWDDYHAYILYILAGSLNVSITRDLFILIKTLLRLHRS